MCIKVYNSHIGLAFGLRDTAAAKVLVLTQKMAKGGFMPSSEHNRKEL